MHGSVASKVINFLRFTFGRVVVYQLRSGLYWNANRKKDASVNQCGYSGEKYKNQSGIV